VSRPVILIIGALLGIATAGADEYLQRNNDQSLRDRPLPICALSLFSDGKTVLIDFRSPAVTYSGEFPVDDAARVLFESVELLREEQCK
jgi:hypothetical protein